MHAAALSELRARWGWWKTNRATGREGSGERERTASEPMDRTKEHKGSYGGEGGEPRTSSDQRESHGTGGKT